MRVVFWSYPLRSSPPSPPSKEGECGSYEDQAGLVGVSGEVVNIMDKASPGTGDGVREDPYRLGQKPTRRNRKPKRKQSNGLGLGSDVRNAPK